MLLLVVLMAVAVDCIDENSLPLQQVNQQVNIPSPECTVSVLEGGKQGREVTSVVLDTELYYRVDCRPKESAPASQTNAFCLNVFNCTIGNGANVYPIINEQGCTYDDFHGLFHDVSYESDLVAGIFNPYPVRFRESGRVVFHCATTLFLKGNQDCDDIQISNQQTGSENLGALGAQFDVEEGIKGVTINPLTVLPPDSEEASAEQDKEIRWQQAVQRRVGRAARFKRMLQYRRGCHINRR